MILSNLPDQDLPQKTHSYLMDKEKHLILYQVFFCGRWWTDPEPLLWTVLIDDCFLCKDTYNKLIYHIQFSEMKCYSIS